MGMRGSVLCGVGSWVHGAARRTIVPATAAFVLAAACSNASVSPAFAAGDANATACPQETEASPGFREYLPDCRAYELVSPPYTQGEPIKVDAVSTNGSHLVVSSPGAFAGTETSGATLLGANYEFTRTSVGWTAASLVPPASDPRFGISHYVAAGTDLSRTLWEGSTSSEGEEETAAYDFYLREEGSGGEVSFSEVGPARRAFTFMGASSDLGHILVTKGGQLYEYTGLGNTEPRLVGVKNEGALHGSPNVNEGAEPISTCGTAFGSPGSEDDDNAISSDGETVFFTALHQGCATPTVNELYARVAGSKTVDISEPVLPAGEQCTGACASAAHSEGVFRGASADGSKVFFITSQPLLDSDKDSTADLYEAELEGGKVKKLTMVSEGETRGTPSENDPTPGEGADVLGVVRVSEDGSRVYFVAEGILTQAKNSQGASAASKGRNLYVFDTLTGRTAFVGTLQSQAAEVAARTECEAVPLGAERRACINNLEPGVLEIWRSEDQRSAQATPNGDYLIFTTLAHLTTDDTSGPLVPQLFRYDAEDGQLTRVSIGEDGVAENGNASIARYAPRIQEPVRHGSAGPTDSAFLPDVTAQGTVFFESADGLVPLASSEETSVFEYAAGNVYLISDGQDETLNNLGASDVELLGADESGEDVFFQTGDPLVPQQTGTQLAWYDARVDGGFPAPAPSAECYEACQNRAEYTPLLGAPVSVSYPGGENLPPQVKAQIEAKSTPKAKSKAPTRAQELEKALKACRSKPARQRKGCAAKARMRYGGRSSRATKSAGRSR